MKIAISGLSGCGNTTACTNVGKALGLEMVNYTLRHAAQETGLSLSEMQKLAGKHLEIDAALDAKLTRLVEKKQDCIVGTRLSGWSIDADLSVWLHASLDTRAKRIASRGEGDLEKVKEATDKRDKQNINRYKELYGIDTLHHDHFDLVVNTERLTPEQVAALIAAASQLARDNWEKLKNPFPQRIKTIIAQKLSSENLSKIKDKSVLKVIQCLQFK
ncbi:cytidylate kinase family protein [Candidatus Micrarchaeota archaeon]|nr:cytidylate kinase family protein [Candidatus Micrarchaeota archaeon]